ncbi:hypothetical protein D3C84_1078320 [compost metagenome]
MDASDCVADFLGLIFGFMLGANVGLGAGVTVGCTEVEGVLVGDITRMGLLAPASSVTSCDSTKSLLAPVEVWVTSGWACWAER